MKKIDMGVKRFLLLICLKNEQTKECVAFVTVSSLEV